MKIQELLVFEQDFAAYGVYIRTIINVKRSYNMSWSSYTCYVDKNIFKFRTSTTGNTLHWVARSDSRVPFQVVL